MNFDEVINAHTRWKFRLKDYIDGASQEKLVAADIAKDNECTLGRWIEEQLPKHGDDQDFLRLRNEHALFHQQAAQVVSACDQGKRDEARAMLGFGTPYAKLSSSVVLLIKRIQQKLGA